MEKKFDAFISYRRDTGSLLAVAIHTQLNSVNGVPTFLDVADLKASRFDNQLKQKINEIPNFILLLTPGSLDRCSDENDWVRQEIALAIETDRNIIPVMVENFSFPPASDLPEDIRDILNYNAVPYVHAYFGASIDRIVQFLRMTDNTDQNAPLPKAIKETQTMKDSLEDKRASQSNGFDEQKYINALQIAYDDTQITAAERDKLNCLAMDLGILPARAKELEEQVRKEKEAASNQATSSPQEATEPASAASPNSVDLEWPKVGIQFLNKVFDQVSPHLSFTPESVSEPAEIEEECCAWWYVKDKHHIAIELDKKRADNISVLWGFYSENEKRDPLFRKIAADLESQGALSEGGKSPYTFMPDNYTQLFAERRVNISELANQAFVDEIVKKLIEFCEIFWKVAQKHYQQGGEEDVQVESNEPTPTTVSADSLFSGLEWPELGHAFLKEIRKSVDVSLLPFNPVVVSSDEDIEDRKDPEIDWDINDMLYFSVWFSRKYGDKVTLTWGFFAVNEQRDPLFRTTFDPNKNNEFGELSDNDGCVLLNGAYYFFDSSDSLRFVAEKKLVMSAINQDLVLEISQHVIAATNKFWPVVRKRYENQAEA